MSDAQRLDPVNNKEHRFLHKAMNTDFFGEEKVLPKLDNQDPRYALFRAADLLSILLNKPEGYTKAELEPMIKNLGYMHLGIGQRDNQPPSPIGILDDYVTLQGGKWKIKKEYLTLDKEITIKYKKAGFQEVSLNYCNAIVSILNNTKMAQDNFKLNKVTMDLKPEEQQAKEEKKKNSVKKTGPQNGSQGANTSVDSQPKPQAQTYYGNPYPQSPMMPPQPYYGNPYQQTSMMALQPYYGTTPYSQQPYGYPQQPPMMAPHLQPFNGNPYPQSMMQQYQYGYPQPPMTPPQPYGFQQNDLKQKEVDIKNKELDLKNKELDIKKQELELEKKKIEIESVMARLQALSLAPQSGVQVLVNPTQATPPNQTITYGQSKNRFSGFNSDLSQSSSTVKRVRAEGVENKKVMEDEQDEYGSNNSSRSTSPMPN